MELLGRVLSKILWRITEDYPDFRVRVDTLDWDFKKFVKSLLSSWNEQVERVIGGKNE